MSENPTTESKVSMDWLEKDVFVGTDDAGHSIVFDSALSGSPARGFGPMKALLAALGACSGMDVAAILGKRKQKVTSLKIEVVGKRPQYGHPKPFTEVALRFVVAGDKLDEKYVKEAVGDSVEK
ncbi:MAG TPA: OsmC family protein, partial [Nitrososphaerales archaeon]|nr:OsmC family protein [Nitrososphaerales archaeon]